MLFNLKGSDNIESYKRFTDEQIERANRVDIIQLAELKGYPIIKNGAEYRIKDMGGLVLDQKKNRWFSFSKDKGGGPIQFLQEIEGLTWKDAVKELINEEGQYQERLISKEQENVLEEPLKKFALPEKNNTYKHLYAYLMKTRLIHPEVIQFFVDEGLLYENTKHSCVFVGKDNDGTPRYANIHGTNTLGNTYKGEPEGSDKRFSFAKRGSNNKLTLFEAPIDLLSYMSIYKIRKLDYLIKDDHLLSLNCCMSTRALEQYLHSNPQINSIQLALDNDKWGNEACAKFALLYSEQYKVTRIRFNEKDMNEVLIAYMKKIVSMQKELAMQKKSHDLVQEP